ncbi:MAG: hypothetical protein LBJ59_12115 [Zoogloeaceae bacterium]|jgi:hypothetical protein|nr:hypothetical protein [Zoogloeaceae bacterium]
MPTTLTVRGSGGSSDKPHTPVEAPDSLRSSQYARIIDVLGEGEIVGLVDGLKSIYLDDTPLEDVTGKMNFDGIAVQTRTGTQFQSPVEGFPEVENEIAVAVEVKNDTPLVRSIVNVNINAVRVTIRIPALLHQNDKGDTNGTSVSVAFDVQNDGGGWQSAIVDTITGKTTSGYKREYRIALPSGGPWEVRMRRLTGDSTTASTLQNSTFWDSYTEIIDARLSYPNCALVALQFSAEQFQRLPTRGYHARGLIIKVPSNYDPGTRKYDGVWDGTFKPAWTNNPAWVFYDICTNDRYGLGALLDVSQVDKWGLYSIAQYCDELVPDGFGEVEPRFTIFYFQQSREQAYTLLTSLASVFRAITYWSVGQVVAVQDRPADVIAQFTAANVIEGQFHYSGSSLRARHTVALVTWNDPKQRYQQVVEAVVDDEGVARYGINETEVVAVGCTSRGQAHRFGKWILYSERFETETVSFRAGLDAARVFPGAIIQTLDPYRAGKRFGGRLKDATVDTLTLDAPAKLEPGMSYSVTVVLPSGKLQSRDVAWVGDDTEDVDTLTLASPLDDVPLQWSIWVLAGSELVPETWRVMSVTLADDPGQIDITALAHDSSKFGAVEEGLMLEPKPTTTLTSRPGPVTDLVAQTVLRMLNSAGVSTRITIGWLPPASGAVRYVIAWRRDDENWKSDSTNQPSYDIDDVPIGTFTIRVVAVNALGREGPYAEIEHEVDESATAPDIQNLRLDPDFDDQNCPITWDAMPEAVQYQVCVFDGDDNLLREAWVTINAYMYTYALNLADGGPHRALRFEVVAYTMIGHSANPASLAASNPAPATPQGITVEAGPGQIGVAAQRPSDPDLVGMLVWMGPSADVPLDAAHLVYQGGDNAYMKTGLAPGVSMYFRLAFYDRFGTVGLNISTSVMGTPHATGGLLVVDELPDSPDDVGGEMAVFLNTEDSDRRGLWGWNGEEWIFTHDGANLIANSVTAAQINVEELSAISGNMGTITAGNFTLDALGFIKGGAMSWSAGTGFWQGYDDAKYKWRVGDPTGAGAEWDGTNFTIYGPDGSVTLRSGGSVGGYEDWGDLADSLGKINPTNVSTVIANAAIGAAQIGSIALVGTGNFSVKSANAGARLEMNGEAIKVYDENGVLRVQLGNLEV